MNWTAYIDDYCERVAPGLGAEPLNAVTNLLFLVAAAWMWRRARQDGLGTVTVLCVVLAAIGVASGLNHTLAVIWAGAIDTLAILVFILIYIFAINRDVVGWPVWAATVATLGFVPYAAGLTILISDWPFFGISSFYWSVPVLIFLYAAILRARHALWARGVAIGGLLLCVSITIRSVDQSLCQVFPIGTHFVWHALNATLLFWMIEVYRQHHLFGGLAGRASGR